jgi:predicted O-linked N-acetylglucosamine transferase (SPINDLY family)
MYHGRDDLPIKQAYAAVFRNCFPEHEPPRCSGQPRIGLVVTDRHEGIFGRSLKGVIRHMRRSEFDLIVACSPRGAASLRGELGDRVGFVILPDDLTGAAAALEAAACDVLYHWEAGTDALNYFLPFLRLAPVQCTSWGLQVTSGIPTMDYYLSAAEAEPPGAERHYSETLIEARALLSYQYRETLPPSRKGRNELGLPAARNVYLCAQQIGKFHPDFDAILAAILRGDGRGVLVITRDRWGHDARRLLERFRGTMPDVVDRVLLLPRMEHPDYLALVATADVVLDPPYYGGVNTTYDALSLGTPVVTLPGAYHIARYSAACIARTQAHACIATDPEDYARRALRLGTDRSFREAMRETILSGGEALFEDPAATHEHERLFLELLAIARA